MQGERLMRWASWILLSFVVLAICLEHPVRSDDTKKETFFNGKNLDGWKGLEKFWKVEDGAIVGSTFPDGGKFNTFLCSTKKYKDFELQFQVKLRGEGWSGNSGVQIRSKIANKEHLAVAGPQCDMGD